MTFKSALAIVTLAALVSLAVDGLMCITASADLTPADAVKEYAMNRLCKIGRAECERLDQFIIKEARHGSQP